MNGRTHGNLRFLVAKPHFSKEPVAKVLSVLMMYLVLCCAWACQKQDFPAEYLLVCAGLVVVYLLVCAGPSRCLCATGTNVEMHMIGHTWFERPRLDKTKQ